MAADRVRVEAYTAALRAAIRPGHSVVLEIGTGTGLFAILACRMGARRVYAVEADDIIETARLDAAANGCSDRIDFRHDLSTRVDLPEPADVLVSDLRGVLPYHEGHIAAIVDARRRLLAPGARIIPAADRVWMACVDARGAHEALTAPWQAAAGGVELAAARALAVNAWQRADIRAEQLRTEPASCGALDYATIEEPDFACEVAMPVTRSGAAHGLCAWFETTLADGIGFASAPGATPLVYGQAWFPWPQAVELRAGDVVAANVRARLLGADYTWSWNSRVRDAQGVERRRFRQSNLLGTPLSSDTLRRRSAEHVARIDDEARVDRLALGRMEDGAALGAIARELSERFPVRFASADDALAHVGDLSLRYGR